MFEAKVSGCWLFDFYLEFGKSSLVKKKKKKNLITRNSYDFWNFLILDFFLNSKIILFFHLIQLQVFYVLTPIFGRFGSSSQRIRVLIDYFIC